MADLAGGQTSLSVPLILSTDCVAGWAAMPLSSANSIEQKLRIRAADLKEGDFTFSLVVSRLLNGEGQIQLNRVRVDADGGHSKTWSFEVLANDNSVLLVGAKKYEDHIKDYSIVPGCGRALDLEALFGRRFAEVMQFPAWQALVSRETWNSVQAILNRRIATKQHRIKRDFAFSGFVRCGHCGCYFVGELKKQRYVYYHCTGHRGKCPEPYTREEAMHDQLADSLRALVIPRGVLNWLQEAVVESDLNERAARERETKRLEEQHRLIDSKLEAMYEDRLEGRITPEMYDRKARELREQALELSRRINEVQASAPAPVQDAIDLMDLTSRAADLFLVQPAPEKQRFMRLVMKDATWRDGQLQIQFEEPFENLRRSNQLSQTKHEENGMRNAEIAFWLVKLISNLYP